MDEPDEPNMEERLRNSHRQLLRHQHRAALLLSYVRPMATISQPKVAKKKAKNEDSSSDEDSDDDTKRQEKKTDHNAPIETMLDFSYGGAVRHHRPPPPAG